MVRKRLSYLLRTPLPLVRVRARAPEDRPAARQDPARRLDRELLKGVLEHAAPAVAKADHLISVGVDPLAHDGTDHGIQSGTVPASGEQCNAHYLESQPADAACAAATRAIGTRNGEQLT